MEKSCWNCKNKDLCFVYENINREITIAMHRDILEDEMKYCIGTIFESISEACLEYQKDIIQLS